VRLTRRENMTTKNVCIALALISAAACGGGYSSGPPSQTPGNTPPPTGAISVTNNAFSPDAKSVSVNTSVQWAWNSCSGDPYGGTQTCVSHDVVFDDGATSGLKDQGTYSRTFAAAGTYNYHCSVHGTAMSGTITVQ
jgi:plastocyanin